MSVSVASSIELTLNYRCLIVLSVVLALAPVSTTKAQEKQLDTPLLSLQAKAEDLYRKGHWERAYFIYVNELAAKGDKYSQYMAGYMCMHGKGVKRDKIRASAWYRLAAERDAPDFVELRDKTLAAMSEEERLASDAIFLELRQRYSDLQLILDDVAEVRDEIYEPPTGSRLARTSGSSSVSIIDPHTGIMIKRSEYVRRVEKLMQGRLDYIAEVIGDESLHADMSDRDFDELRERVVAYLQTVNDR